MGHTCSKEDTRALRECSTTQWITLNKYRNDKIRSILLVIVYFLHCAALKVRQIRKTNDMTSTVSHYYGRMTANCYQSRMNKKNLKLSRYLTSRVRSEKRANINCITRLLSRAWLFPKKESSTCRVENRHFRLTIMTHPSPPKLQQLAHSSFCPNITLNISADHFFSTSHDSSELNAKNIENIKILQNPCFTSPPSRRQAHAHENTHTLIFEEVL